MKKISSLVFYCIVIFCTIIIFSLNSCSEVEAVEAVEVTKIEPIGLSAEKSQYAPYEIVTIPAAENFFTVQSFTAKINDMEIVVVVYENSAAFVLPNLNNGNYKLEFTLNTKNYFVPMTVSSLPNILGADQYFNDVQTSINQNINEINLQITQLEQNSTNPNEYTNLQNDVIKYTKLFNDYKALYNNLSAVEKQEFAKSMAANKNIIDEYNALTAALNSSNALLRTSQPVQDYEAAVELSATQFINSLEYTVAHVPIILIGAKLVATPTGISSIGATIATGLVVTSFMFNVIETASAAVTLTNKSLIPYEFIAQTSQDNFSSGVETVTIIQAKYRSLMASDGSNAGNGSTIITIVEKYNYFKDQYNGFISYFPSVFRPSNVMTSLKNSFNSTTRSIFNKYVGISNISNPNVTLQQLNQPDGSILVKATSTDDNDQTFTYDVNYTNGSFTIGLAKKMDAMVLSSNPCIRGTMSAPIITDVQLDCYTNYGFAILVSFTANGTGILPYSGYLSCDPAQTCYPVRLYFLNPGATEYSIAVNSYSANLISGNINSGIVAITMVNDVSCINGQSAAQAFHDLYGNVEFKVELINQCNQRSNQVSF
ncbi:hypothetical protein [Gillisia sp. CAL575]|uniref:hypothetical protein n=1 Tax=Gillisia sp. CAL575 TaxID=985255 RepID=UPI00039DC058|nr:hypothetical protein [Gillisia sp. CAL575]